MGFWSTLDAWIFGVPGTTNVASPFAEPNNLAPAILGDWMDAAPAEIVTPELALRVPEVNRALQAHTALVAPLKFTVWRDGVEIDQPLWVNNSASGISPYLRWTGVVRDLFLHGWAVVGAELGADNLPVDMIHIPRNLWYADSDGQVRAKEDVPANFRQRLIVFSLGSNGLMNDGIDSIRQARKLEQARQARLDTPPAATELHITDPSFDEMTPAEMSALAKNYSEQRNKHAVSVTPSYLQVNPHPNDDVDLFESGMNSLRLQLAMHTGVPASFLEAGKEGGSTGQMSYTNENGKASELWIFGSARFAYAITARLSMDDVVGPNAEVRADLSDFMVPTPNQLSVESPVTSTPTVEDVSV